MIDFELIVPDGWAHIPTAPEMSRVREQIIRGIVRHALPDTLPRDKAGPWRRMLTRELTEATDEAERQGARAVVLPVQEMAGMRLPGTLLLSVIEDPDESSDPRTVLDSLLADAGTAGMALEIGAARPSGYGRSSTAAPSNARPPRYASTTTWRRRTHPASGGR